MFMLPMAQYHVPYIDLGENMNSSLTSYFEIFPPKPKIKETKMAMWSEP